MTLNKYVETYVAGKQFVSEFADSKGELFLKSLESLIQSEIIFEAGLHEPVPSLFDSGLMLRTRRKIRRIIEILSESKQRASVSLEFSDQPLAEDAFTLFKVAFSNAYQQEFGELVAEMENQPLT